MLWDSEMKFEPNISRIIGLIPKSESVDVVAVQEVCRLTRWPLDMALGKSFVARDQEISALGNLHSWVLHGSALQTVEQKLSQPGKEGRFMELENVFTPWRTHSTEASRVCVASM